MRRKLAATAFMAWFGCATAWAGSRSAREESAAPDGGDHSRIRNEFVVGGGRTIPHSGDHPSVAFANAYVFTAVRWGPAVEHGPEIGVIFFDRQPAAVGLHGQYQMRVFMSGHAPSGPYFGAGFGAVYTNLEVFELVSRFNFSPHVFAGAKWGMGGRKVGLEYRFSHFSNAGIKEPNWGMESHVGLFSFEF